MHPVQVFLEIPQAGNALVVLERYLFPFFRKFGNLPVIDLHLLIESVGHSVEVGYGAGDLSFGISHAQMIAQLVEFAGIEPE